MNYESTTVPEYKITFSDISEIIKKCLNMYIERSIIPLSNSSDQVFSFITKLEAELIDQCSNKNFIALNINVIREHQTRVITDSALRAFYLELHKLFCLIVRFDYGVNDIYRGVFENFIDVYKDEPLIDIAEEKTIFKNNSLANSGLCLQTPEFKDLASKIKVLEEVNVFMNSNPWYYIYLIVNIFSHELLSFLVELRQQTTKTP